MTTLTISGGVVHVDARRLDADVVIVDSRIEEVQPRRPGRVGPRIDARNCSVLPGFVDLQVNGAIGVDLTTQPERMGEVAAFLVQCGVTSLMPTVISSAPADVATAIATLHGFSGDEGPGARSLGVHLEGPFLNPARAGAHPRHQLRLPSLSEVQHWRRDVGVAMVTLAPELPQALDVIRQLVACGVSVCAGHTEAGPVEMGAAIGAGLRGVTHLFNAMPAMSARQPGPAGTALADSALIAGLIVDGLHVDPAMVRLAWSALGPARLVLVSDAMSALGLPHGPSSIGETPVVVDVNGARTVDGVLAGSVLHFDEAVRNLIAFTGCDLAAASLCASATPARLAQRADVGRLVAGCLADIVVLDERNQVAVTMVGGRVAFDPQQRCTGF